ncbi:MAG: CRISPR-associated endoribonuclease Cas6 [candidate division WOR-3 bacterium]
MGIDTDEITLFSIHLKLAGPWKPSNFPGETLHGFLFSLPGLKDYHEAETKPFSLRLVKHEGRTLKLEVCSLRFDLAEKLSSAGLARGARIGNVGVSDMLISPLSSTNFGRLLRIRPRTRFTFRFRSPTSFRSQGQQILFPTPELLFGSLMQKWNAFARKKITREIADDFRNILVTRYSLETQEVSFSDYKIIGFTGEISYRFPTGIDPMVKIVVNALARLAPYSGVGYKTPMGLGWVEVKGDRKA